MTKLDELHSRPKERKSLNSLGNYLHLFLQLPKAQQAAG